MDGKEKDTRDGSISNHCTTTIGECAVETKNYRRIKNIRLRFLYTIRLNFLLLNFRMSKGLLGVNL